MIRWYLIKREPMPRNKRIIHRAMVWAPSEREAIRKAGRYMRAAQTKLVVEHILPYEGPQPEMRDEQLGIDFEGWDML